MKRREPWVVTEGDRRLVTGRGVVGACLLTFCITLIPLLVTIVVTNNSLHDTVNDNQAEKLKVDLVNCDTGNSSRAGIRALFRGQEQQSKGPQSQALLKLLFPDPATQKLVARLQAENVAKAHRLRFAVLPMRDCPRTIAKGRPVTVPDRLADEFVVATAKAAEEKLPLPKIRDNQIVYTQGD